MREILFKGKRKDNGEWIEGFYVCLGNDLHYILTGKLDLTKHCVMFEKHAVIPETVGQYTGLTDKNGTKIFEGDIVTLPKYGGGKTKSVVYFKGGKFAVDGLNYVFMDICTKNMVVIGNIHDNPNCQGVIQNEQIL